MNRDIFRLAIPNIISNITIPILSMIDMVIVGHLSLDVFIGAIATVSILFNFLYWSMSFLRMGTSGFTAQAYGAGDKNEEVVILLRSLSFAFGASLFILIFQTQIFNIFFRFVNTSPEVKLYAYQYFRIYVWAAPAILGLYGFTGWFIGMQDARTPMIIAISINIVNIILSLTFVYFFNMELSGVALGSTIAQIAGFILAFLFWKYKYNSTRFDFNFKEILNLKGYVQFLRVNTNIFIRTALLISVTTFFTATSASMGDTILAANALLMQLFILFSYMMDGFAYSAEALTGRFIGSERIDKLRVLIKYLFAWGVGLALGFTLIYGLFTEQILSILTDKRNIIDICLEYKTWTLIIPIAGFSAFLWDGIFIGATASKQMRNSMFISTLAFFSIYFLSRDALENDALWLSFVVYLAMRGAMQSIMYNSIKKNLHSL